MSELVKLDRFDIRILSLLQRNGRMTNVDLSNEIGLSPSPCLHRVRRLEKAGYIAGYGAHIHLEKLGHVQFVFTQVTLSGHTRGDFEKFETLVRDVHEIVECHLISGAFTYLLKFVTRDLGHYQRVAEDVLREKGNVEKYFSYIVIASPSLKGQYPLDKLA